MIPSAGPHSGTTRWAGRNFARCSPPPGPHARAAAPVRDAERLVKVQVAYVRTDAPRLAQPYEGVQVGPVQVHLPASFVHDAADLRNTLLEHAVGGRIRDHQRGETAGEPVGLGAQVVQVDVAVIIAVHHHHAHARQHRAGRIGAVGGAGYEADVALLLAVGRVILPDHQQP